MYKITDYTLKQAEKYKLDVKPSTKKNKKLDVYDKRDGQYITSVGAYGYKDYPTYMLEKGEAYAEKKRNAYYKRFKDIKPYTNAYYASLLLW